MTRILRLTPTWQQTKAAPGNVQHLAIAQNTSEAVEIHSRARHFSVGTACDPIQQVNEVIKAITTRKATTWAAPARVGSAPITRARCTTEKVAMSPMKNMPVPSARRGCPQQNRACSISPAAGISDIAKANFPIMTHRLSVSSGRAAVGSFRRTPM